MVEGGGKKGIWGASSPTKERQTFFLMDNCFDHCSLCRCLHTQDVQEVCNFVDTNPSCVFSLPSTYSRLQLFEKQLLVSSLQHVLPSVLVHEILEFLPMSCCFYGIRCDKTSSSKLNSIKSCIGYWQRRYLWENGFFSLLIINQHFAVWVHFESIHRDTRVPRSFATMEFVKGSILPEDIHHKGPFEGGAIHAPLKVPLMLDLIHDWMCLNALLWIIPSHLSIISQRRKRYNKDASETSHSFDDLSHFQSFQQFGTLSLQDDVNFQSLKQDLSHASLCGSVS